MSKFLKINLYYVFGNGTGGMVGETKPFFDATIQLQKNFRYVPQCHSES